MTNRFEIEGLAARQVQCHFANICHVALDTRPSLVFFQQVKKAERGLGMRLHTHIHTHTQHTHLPSHASVSEALKASGRVPVWSPGGGGGCIWGLSLRHTLLYYWSFHLQPLPSPVQVVLALKCHGWAQSWFCPVSDNNTKEIFLNFFMFVHWSKIVKPLHTCTCIQVRRGISFQFRMVNTETCPVVFTTVTVI